MKIKRSRKAFTIVELVIVIAVIAVLATVLVPIFGEVIQNAKDSAAKQEAKNAYTEYMIENAGKGEMLELFLYKAEEDRIVAIQSGVVVGVYNIWEEACKALELAEDAKFNAINGKLYVYSNQPETEKKPVSLPSTSYNSVFGDDYQKTYPMDWFENNVSLPHSPYAYQNISLFENKKITKIGVPVGSVKKIDENQFFTLWVIKSDTLVTGGKIVEGENAWPYKVYLPKDELGDSTTVNRWITVDVSHLNIYVRHGETLAFLDPGDTVTPRYRVVNTYPFYHSLKTSVTAHSWESVFFDVYTEDCVKLTGKKFSILGDSISTYSGVSNDAVNSNSTIGNNAKYYPVGDIDTVEKTWWKQATSYTGMEVLVNNSWSGSFVLSGSGVAYVDRCVQLHDNTGENAGTNPDVIAVYIGINDFIYERPCGEFNALTDIYDSTSGYITPETFAQAYAIMIHKITEKYNNADIFVFTLPANGRWTNEALLNAYNTEIKKIADYFNCYLVDIAAIEGYDYMKYTWDSEHLHPNKAGMDLITDYFVRILKAVY